MVTSLLEDPMFADIPEQFRTPIGPRDLTEKTEYLKAWILHIRNSRNFTFQEKLTLLRAYGRKLEKTEEAAKNQHECACCGITLRIPAPVGPECAKHPNEFPCDAHRGRRA